MRAKSPSSSAAGPKVRASVLRLRFSTRGSVGPTSIVMTWGDIVGDAIQVAQQKTAAKLTIPIHEALDRVLSTANRSHSTILVTAYGGQFSVKGFGQMISEPKWQTGCRRSGKLHGRSLKNQQLDMENGAPSRIKPRTLM
jgi:hypothetical protein